MFNIISDEKKQIKPNEISLHIQQNDLNLKI